MHVGNHPILVMPVRVADESIEHDVRGQLFKCVIPPRHGIRRVDAHDVRQRDRDVLDVVIALTESELGVVALDDPLQNLPAVEIVVFLVGRNCFRNK